MTDLDRRINAWRPDLADQRLEGRVAAGRFVAGEDRRVVASSAAIRRAPQPDAAIDTEALRGEVFRIFEETPEGWAWGQLATDSYVGWISTDALGPLGAAPTHRVTALRTFLYPAPDMKLPPLGALSLGAALVLGEEVETRGTRFHRLAGGEGAIVARHVAPLSDPAETDFVAVAERFLNVPYLWGGRTSLGLDCSALVQLSLAAVGVAVPRDTDLQASLGSDVAGEARQRGDVVFWKGHVGILRDADTLLHASGWHMAVVSEPYAEALTRIARTSGAPTGIRRVG